MDGGRLGDGDAGVRLRVLGCPVDAVDMEGAVARIAQAVERRRHDPASPALVVVTLNPEMVMRARRERDLGAIIGRAGLVVPDGVGVVTAMRRRGAAGAVRVAGVDMLLRYAALAAAGGHRIALCGGAPGVAVRAGERLRGEAAGVVVCATDSGDPDAATAARLRSASPDVVLAAYGAGPQERFLDAHLAATGAAVGIGVGGSFDFLAGRVRRAPAPVRAAGMEWAWRLARQPWRARRQAVLPVFAVLERSEARRARRAGTT